MSPNFEVSWQRWQAEYSKHRTGYDKDIWGNIKEHPLDQIIDSLARLYLASSAGDQATIVKAQDNGQIEPWDLSLYIRRTGLRLPLGRNEKLIDWAFGVVMICHNHVDPRDVIVSIALMAFGAEKAGINIKQRLDALGTTPSGVDRLFDAALDQSEAGINITLKMFGPPEWSLGTET